MRRRVSALMLWLLSIPAFAGTEIKPTTTLTAEIGNNTSAADSFAGQPNGNIAAGNVSKLPIRNLLYQGSTTKLYAHMMPWFGGSNHASVGYNSADPAQAVRQVKDMVSRGIDGMIIDWYGPTFWRENTSSLNLLAAAQNVPNFELAIMEDVGALNTTDNTAKLISDLNYVWTNFAQSPIYMRRNGRPVIFFFGVESKGIDLAYVKSQLPWNPIFIFENDNAFTMASSDGAFSWVPPTYTNYANYTGLAYLDDFYWNAQRNTSKFTYGSAYKGFNDIIAAWAPPGGRHLEQFCGQTWINSLKRAGNFFNSSSQLANLQLVTWNDYEEGTAIEPGIDNCLSISASVNGDSLTWSITGQENTLAKYQVFISADGTNLMPLTTAGTGIYSHDLAQYQFAPGTYKLFVKAVGQPSIVNHMSAAATYVIAAPPPPTTPPTDNPPPPVVATDFAVSTGGTMTVPRGTSATMPLSVAGVNGSFNTAVTFSCSGLPVAMACTFSPASVTPGSAAVSTTLTISTTQTQQAGAAKRTLRFGLVGSAFCVLGLAMMGGMTRQRRALGLALAIAAITVTAAGLGCGGAAKTQAPAAGPTMTAQGSYSIQIISAGGGTQHTSVVKVTVY